ncbi:MAG: FRG domain-containing protein [Candidatus Aenigmarchaeota archaeon]|nr:FRG domain-containing protein [Candidatus Aenigmarchaeota archaeon]
MGETVQLDTWEEFEEQVLQLISNVKEQRKKAKIYISDPIYRGHEDASWELRTTLERYTGSSFSMEAYHRIMESVKPSIDTFTGKPQNLERYVEPKADEFPAPPPGCDYMAYLRHYSFPSPLLDWTRSPYVAAFFAFRPTYTRPRENVAIYSYREHTGQGKAWRGGDAEIVGITGSIAPTRRHYIQQSEYTICRKLEGKTYRYCVHEEVFRQERDDQDLLCKFILPSTEQEKILEKLAMMNINALSLFGSDESLMGWLAYERLKRQD